MEKNLHIICLNVPYPVDYGGVFDLYYKLPALKKLGVKIHLHCFNYGRGEQVVLKEHCEDVYYYKRISGLGSLSFNLPYIVASRKNEDLLNRLVQDDYPILMEGIHCTYLLTDHRFANRKCFVRLHNVEFTYYKNLFYNSSSLFKKLYYLLESSLLKKYETKILNKAAFFSVIPKDTEVYKKIGCRNISYLPLFLPPWKVSCHLGLGTFCLYQGDLSVAENEKAAMWLLEKVFANIEIPFVVAGKNPSEKLISFTENKTNTCIVANPTEKEMQDMIEKAQINIIPSFNNTGIKLKLINALYNGRFCIVNKATVEGTGLESACYIVEDAESFRNAVKHIFLTPFSQNEIEIRRSLLDEMFNNEANAQQLLSSIWNES